MKPLFVDLLHCSDGLCYMGQADDMAVRFRQHGGGLIGGAALRTLRLRLAQLKRLGRPGVAHRPFGSAR